MLARLLAFIIFFAFIVGLISSLLGIYESATVRTLLAPVFPSLESESNGGVSDLTLNIIAGGVVAIAALLFVMLIMRLFGRSAFASN